MADKLALLIDDDRDFARELTVVLTQDGYSVVTAKNGDAGLRQALALTPQLVCLDLTLPHLSGFDVCEGIRREEALAGCAIVVVSARTTPLVKTQALECGADAYVAKPFDRRRLLIEIARATAARSGVQLAEEPIEPAGWLESFGSFLRTRRA
jgi:two-component system KDP operon response regulator KdpE